MIRLGLQVLLPIPVTRQIPNSWPTKYSALVIIAPLVSGQGILYMEKYVDVKIFASCLLHEVTKILHHISFALMLFLSALVFQKMLV